MPDGYPCRLVQAHAFQVVFRQANPLLVGEDVMAGFNGQAAVPDPVLATLFLRIVFASPVGRIILPLPFQSQVVSVELLLYLPETVRRLAVQVELTVQVAAGGDHMLVMMLIGATRAEKILQQSCGVAASGDVRNHINHHASDRHSNRVETSFHPRGTPFSAMLIGMEIRGTHNQKHLHDAHRNREIHIRVTEQQLSDIQQKAHEAKMSVSKYLTAHALVEQTIHTKQEDEKNATLQAIQAEIHRIGLNINQIAHHLNRRRDLSNFTVEDLVQDVHLLVERVDQTVQCDQYSRSDHEY